MLERLGVRLDEVRREVTGRMSAPSVGVEPRRRWFRRRHAAAGASEELGDEMAATWLVERLDDGALEALAAARRSARERGAGTTGAHDLLVGVASVAGPGADALSAVGQSAPALADVDVGAEDAAGTDDPDSGAALSTTVRDVLLWAAEDALRRGHAEAGTAHLLLALLIVGRRELEPVLDATGVAPEDLHAEIGRRLAA